MRLHISLQHHQSVRRGAVVNHIEIEKTKLIFQYIEREKAVRQVIADMKSNHCTHQAYIDALEKALQN